MPSARLPVIAVVTDTRPPTPHQLTALSAWVDASPPSEAHHLASPSDEPVLVVLREAGLSRLVAHPSSDGAVVSRLALEASDGQMGPLNYYARIARLADVVDVLVALPAGPEGRAGLAGTGTRPWDALRAARGAGRRVVIIHADGEVIEEGGRGAQA
jgi:hypothetical protein